MRTTWCVIFAASAMMGTIDVLHAQPEENFGRNEFLRSCASCHGVSGKGDGPVAKSLSPPPSDLTRLSETNNGVFPVSRVHEVIDGRIERLVHGTRDMPVWGERYMREMISPEYRDFVSKEWAEATVRRRILALVEYISTLQRATPQEPLSLFTESFLDRSDQRLHRPKRRRQHTRLVCASIATPTIWRG
jgi:hypothetical protein